MEIDKVFVKVNRPSGNGQSIIEIYQFDDPREAHEFIVEHHGMYVRYALAKKMVQHGAKLCNADRFYGYELGDMTYYQVTSEGETSDFPTFVEAFNEYNQASAPKRLASMNQDGTVAEVIEEQN